MKLSKVFTSLGYYAGIFAPTALTLYLIRQSIPLNTFVVLDESKPQIQEEEVKPEKPTSDLPFFSSGSGEGDDEDDDDEESEEEDVTEVEENPTEKEEDTEAESKQESKPEEIPPEPPQENDDEESPEEKSKEGDDTSPLNDPYRALIRYKYDDVVS